MSGTDKDRPGISIVIYFSGHFLEKVMNVGCGT